ncbi:MAG: hypothetical protein AABY37_03315 [Actinomycetota bacterium]
MSTIFAGNAFQPTDLQRNHRAVLDAARESSAIIRDKDGLLLIIRPAEEAQLREYVAEALWSAVCLERALQLPAAERGPAMYGPFAWVSVMPEDDQKQFLREVIDQVLVSKNSGSKEKLEDLIEDWRTSALTWSDEDLREELTADLGHPLQDVVL